MPLFKYPLDHNFTYHAPTKDDIEIYPLIRDCAKEYAKLILTHCPQSRELSLALTKIEESVMWANAARARNGAPE